MQMNKLNLKGLEFPTKMIEIPKFEILNDFNLSVFELN